MLRARSPTGSIEALPQQEARLRGLCNAQLRHELLASESPDPFVFAEAVSRELLVYSPQRGWHLNRHPAASHTHA